MNTEISYVKQAHVIAKSAYMMPATSRKLIFFTMAKSAFQKDGFETIEVTENEVLKMMGMTRGGNTYETLRSITKETKQQVFTIEEDGYIHISWMALCQYVKSREVFRFRLDPALKQYVVDIKKHFSNIPLSAIGKLQGKYAIRLFELVLTMSGKEGKDGNPPLTWFYDDTIEMIRHRFAVSDTQYKRTGDFRTRVIDNPVREINEAEIGIHIKPEYIRKGRRLVGIKFWVTRVVQDAPRNVTPVTKAEDEEELLITKYPELYQQFYEEELSQGTLPFEGASDSLMKTTAEGNAIIRLQEATKRKKKGQKISL